MTIWIKQIKLQNFKSYENATFNFPRPEIGKNLIVIGAENGHGKTSLLEAIYLGLFDRDAIKLFERAGLGKQQVLNHGYDGLIGTLLHHKAKSQYGMSFQMSIQIEVAKLWNNQEHSLKILRKWHFNRNRELIEKNSLETRLWISKNGEYQLIDEDEHKDLISQHFIPFEYAPFFFFDGEKLSDQNKGSTQGTWINQAFMGLVGASLLNRLKKDVEDFRNVCRKETGTESEKIRLNKLEHEVNLLNEQLQNALDKYIDHSAKRSQLEAVRDEIQNKLGNNNNIASRSDLILKQEKIKSQLDELNKNFEKALTEMPFFLLPIKEIEQLKQILEADSIRLKHEAGRDQAENRIDDFMHALSNHQEALLELGRNTLNHPILQKAIKESWTKLWYPLPTGASDPMQHNYLSQQNIVEINREIQEITSQKPENLLAVIDNMEKLEQEERSLDTLISNLEGSNHDELIKDLKALNLDISKIDDETGNLKNDVSRLTSEHNSKKKELNDLYGRIGGTNAQSYIKKSQRCERIMSMIDDLTQSLIKTKIHELGEIATKMHSKIAHDERIAHLTFSNDTHTLQYFNHSGDEIFPTLSAAQTQVVFMSIISALANVTQCNAPFVIDTPMGRMDSSHRHNTLNHLTTLPQQVILLSQDAEITPELFQEWKNYIGKTYLIRATDLPESGGAKSQVFEDEYFQ